MCNLCVVQTSVMVALFHCRRKVVGLNKQMPSKRKSEKFPTKTTNKRSGSGKNKPFPIGGLVARYIGGEKLAGLLFPFRPSKANLNFENEKEKVYWIEL